jgi:hypothetical protein
MNVRAGCLKVTGIPGGTKRNEIWPVAAEKTALTCVASLNLFHQPTAKGFERLRGLTTCCS